jgi:NCS1 family nucleobase:cation symporter-1
VLRRGRLDVPDLYRRGGRYEYSRGVNPVAIVALVAGVLPCVPGFLAQAFPGTFGGIAPFWRGLYSYAWFLGFAVAAVVYMALSARARLDPVSGSAAPSPSATGSRR